MEVIKIRIYGMSASWFKEVCGLNPAYEEI